MEPRFCQNKLGSVSHGTRLRKNIGNSLPSKNSSPVVGLALARHVGLKPDLPDYNFACFALNRAAFVGRISREA
jgi:hypothetical protein